MTVTTASFRIDGRHVTRIARDLVLDGDWRKALKVLIDGFEGMDHDIAFKILAGTHTLDGINNDIALLEETDVDYQSGSYDLYCHNTFYHLNQLYKFETLIDHEVVHRDIQRRGLSYDIPAFEDYVRKYLLPAQSFSFDVTTTRKKDRVVIASKLDNNNIPLWFDTDKIPSSAKAFDKQYFPEKEIVSTPVAKPVSNRDVNGLDTVKTDWKGSFRSQAAQATAEHFGFSNVADFSESVRKDVLKAIEERGVQWKEIHIETADIDEVIRYPYELALAYALSRTDVRSFGPSWTPVSPADIKMSNDSRLHSDIWVALGFDFDGSEYDHDTKANMILMLLVSELQRVAFPAGDFTILNSAGLALFEGQVVTPTSKNITKNDILVIPHAGPEFELQAMKAGLVISEVGGKLAHLVIVGRELGLPLVRVDNACTLFKEGVTLILDFKQCSLHIKQ